MSVMLYNKDLYTKAGLDPEKPPTTLKEFAEQARTIDKLGGDSQRHLLRRQLRRLRRVHLLALGLGRRRRRHERRRARTHDRPPGDGRRLRPLPRALRRGRRRAGVQGRGRPDLARRSAERQDRHRAGAVGLARPDRAEGHEDRRRADHRASTAASRRSSAATSIGICATSSNADAGLGLPGLDAVGDEAQVEVIAKNKGVPTRTDLAENKYSSADPRVVTDQQAGGQGQDAVREELQRHLQRPAEPVAATVRGALFGDAAKALDRRQHRHHQVPAAS